MILRSLLFLFVIFNIVSCSSEDRPGYEEPYIPDSEDPIVVPLNDEEMMDLIQKETFNGSFNRERTVTLGITGRL